MRGARNGRKLLSRTAQDRLGLVRLARKEEDEYLLGTMSSGASSTGARNRLFMPGRGLGTLLENFSEAFSNV